MLVRPAEPDGSVGEEKEGEGGEEEDVEEFAAPEGLAGEGAETALPGGLAEEAEEEASP